MTAERKQELATQVQQWLLGAGRTQAELERKTGVNKTNISLIASGKWVNAVIGDAQWMKLGAFFGEKNIIRSYNFQAIQDAAAFAQQHRRVIGIDGYTGAGKSYALEHYFQSSPNVFLVRARRSLGGRTFMREVAAQVGVQASGQVYDMENAVIEKLAAMPNALLIFDECEYLKPASLDSIKTLIQHLDGRCGIIVCGIIRQWLTRLAEREKQGMPQFVRRIGHSWVTMKAVEAKEVRAYAKQNGIADEAVIRSLIRDCKEYDSLTKYVADLVRVAADQKAPLDAELYNSLFHEV